MKLLKAKDVSQKTTFSIPHIHRLASEGKFPRPVKLSESRSGWLEEDVNKWIEACVRGRHLIKDD